MKKNAKKVILTVLAVVLVFGCGVGATLAWLQDTTTPVVNTFTEGKVDIDLFEHQYDSTNNTLNNTEIRGDATVDGDEGNSYKMIPGAVLPKDPTVVVKGGSEACWLFVKIEKANAVDTFLTYSIDASVWTPLIDANSDGVADDGVYYKGIITYTANDTPYNVLTGKQVTVKTSVKMSDMTGLSASNYPKLTFTAYAIQSANLTDTNGDNIVDAADAWAALNPPAAG